MKSEVLSMTPTEFLAVVNQTLGYAYSSTVIVGEVASFKINQGKWVFFDLKDEESSVGCFMSVWNLRIPLEDGMKIAVRGVPKVTKWGKFSFTVEALKPVGEGSLKKAYEILKKKLTVEGLFDSAKKRILPRDLARIGVISSTQAAGYADFVKILNARWGGIKVIVAHTQVQGMDAPDQMIRALKYFNEHDEVDVIAILRGGGSADDLSAFNDEQLVRAVAASKIPVITGIGHEVDESLVDLAADVRASTPSNVAEILTPDRVEADLKLKRQMAQVKRELLQRIATTEQANSYAVHKISEGVVGKFIQPMLVENKAKMARALQKMQSECDDLEKHLQHKISLLEVLNPEKILSQGYAIISGKISPGQTIRITTTEKIVDAEIKQVKERNQK